jgi:hypothetical protein
VLVTRVPMLGSIEERSNELVRQISLFASVLSEQEGRPVRVNVVVSFLFCVLCLFNLLCCQAHSMGGLDARRAAHVLKETQIIASITTISTPHHGTMLAPFMNVLPKLFSGLSDLSPVSSLCFDVRV